MSFQRRGGISEGVAASRPRPSSSAAAREPTDEDTPRPLAAAGEEVFNRRRRSQQGNDRKEGPIVGMEGIRLCSLDS